MATNENKFLAAPRSVLYTPSLDRKRMRKARLTGADVALVDLEDSVPQAQKDAARDLCVDFLESGAMPRRTAVRINETRSQHFLRDVLALIGASTKPDIILLTMVTTGAEVEIVRSMLRRADVGSDLYVTVETPDSIANIDEISKEADGLIFGSADYSAFLGVEISWENMLYARQRIAAAAARYETVAIDTACYELENMDLLRAESERARALGYHGKAAVHPSQLGVINEAFSVSSEALKHAERTVQASTIAGGGVARVDGVMIGPPFVRKARRLLRRGNGGE